MRVHELAKELGLSSKALMDLLAKMKVAAKSHSSSLDDATAERVRQQVKGAAKAQQSAAPAAPARIAKTPTGERILGMRKIIPPPAPEPQPELQAEVQSPEPETAGRVPAQAELAPAQAKAAPPVVEEARKVVPKAEPEAPARPAARAPQAPAAPKVAPKETRPVRPSGMPHRPMLRPVPPRKDAPRGPAPARTGGDLSPAAPAPATGQVRPGGPPPPRGRGRRRRERVPPPLPTPPPPPPSVPAEIELSGPLAVAELAAKLELPGGEIVKRLLEHGILAGINRQIPLETAMKVVESFGSSVRKHGDGEVQAPAAPRRLEFADRKSVV